MSQMCPSILAKAQDAIIFPPRSGQQTHSLQITKSSLIVLRKAEEEFEKRSSPQQGKKLGALSADLATGELNGAERWRTKKKRTRKGGAIQPQDDEKLLTDQHTD